MTIAEALQIAVQHHQAGRLAESEALYRQILAAAPQHADALHLLGVIAHQAGRSDVALGMITQAISLSSAVAAYHSNLGEALRALGRYEEAVAAFRRAVQLQPGYAEALSNLGNALVATGQFDDAAAASRAALASRPDFPDALNNLGVALARQARFADAVAAFRRAVQIAPQFAAAWGNLGGALGESGHLGESCAAFRRALELQPQVADTHGNLGATLVKQGRINEAIAAFRHALTLKPDDPRTRSNLLVTLQLSPGLDPAELFREHRRWDEIHALPLAAQLAPHPNAADPARRLRIGYLSADFREHSVAYFLEGLLAAHDRAGVEIFCYADLRHADSFTGRMRRHADAWREITGLADADVARQIRDDRIDILVDLAGHTAGNRLAVFARKPAPVQVTWLGYCATTGLRAMDYRFTDAYADPPGTTEQWHTEKLVRLPGAFACFRPADEAPPVGPPPATARGGVTFGSFHTLAKLNDPLLEQWAAILRQVPASRLLLVATGLDESSCRQRFIDFFAKRGIEPARLEFRARQTLVEYLALHGEVDLLLDAHPFSGHTVSCHALWMGVPVVTLAGESHCSRMVTSVLMNLGRPDWVAATPGEYVNIACALASDLPRLAELRASLRGQMAASPLTDAPRFARNIEHAYRELWRTWCATPV